MAKRFLADTNIYGELVVDKELTEIKKLFEAKRNEIIIYGFAPIRKELRATSKTSHVEKQNLRIALLTVYDYFVGNRLLLWEESKITPLAQRYYTLYREFGGSRGERDMMTDLIIVACAAIHDIDILVSNDDSSMLSDPALRAYKAVNETMNVRMPSFINYKEFKRLLLC